jgi:hypothetical protein
MLLQSLMEVKKGVCFIVCVAAAAMGGSALATTPQQVAAARKHLEEAIASRQQAEARQSWLATQLDAARETLRTAAGREEQLSDGLERLRKSLPGLEKAYAESLRNQKAFDDEYPDLDKAALSHVRKYSAKARYGEAAEAKEVAKTLEVLRSRKAERTAAVARIRQAMQVTLENIQDLERQQLQLTDAVAWAKRTESSIPSEIASSEAMIARLTKEQNVADAKLSQLIEWQKRQAMARQPASAPARQSESFVGIAVVCFVAGVLVCCWVWSLSFSRGRQSVVARPAMAAEQVPVKSRPEFPSNSVSQQQSQGATNQGTQSGVSKSVQSTTQRHDASSGEKPSNKWAQIGFWLGVASIFLSDLGIIPLLGIGFSIAGLSTYEDSKHSRKWQAWWGLGLSVLYMGVNAAKNGHLR